MAKKKAQHGGKRPGAGRKVSPDGPSVVLTVSVPKSLANDLDAYVKTSEATRSKVVAEALRGLLSRRSKR
jgi:hypothetical protein